MKLRGVIEAAICEKFSPDFGQSSEEKMALPMICICVEGGPNTLATCLAALNQGTFMFPVSFDTYNSSSTKEINKNKIVISEH